MVELKKSKPAMSTRSNNSEVAVLQSQVEYQQGDITEIKKDVKEIKLALESNFVTQIEFSNYKSSQFIQKILLSMINLFFGTLIGYVISQLLIKGN